MDSERPGPTIFQLTLQGLEELEHFPTREARARALSSLSDSVRGWALTKGIVLTGGAAVAVLLLLRSVLPRYGPAVFGLRIFQDFSVLFAVATFVLMLRWLHRRDAARALRPMLLDAGVPVCLQCGYLLRGLSQTEHCPECGAAIAEPTRRLLSTGTAPE